MERPTATSARKKQATDISTAWTEDEDQKLLHFIQTHGHGSWRTLPERAGLHRCWKSCRVRWSDHLRPDLKRGNFGEDEEDLIIRLHALLGDRWTLIAGRLAGRTDVEVRNYWNSHIKAKLTSMGIDPQNHRPRQHLHRATSVQESTSREILEDHQTTAISDN